MVWVADGIPINNSIRRWVIARSPNPNCSARHQTLVSTLAYPPPLHLIIETNLQQYSSGAGLLVSVVIAPLYSEQRWPLPPNTWAGPITVNITTLIPLFLTCTPPMDSYLLVIIGGAEKQACSLRVRFIVDCAFMFTTLVRYATAM